MASDETRITVTEDVIEKLKPAEKADLGPLTSNKPLDEMTVTEHEIEKLKPSEEADLGPSTSKKPSNEMPLTNREIKKLRSLGEADTDPPTPNTSNKPLIQEVTQNLRTCYTEECERYFKPTSVVMGPLNHQITIKGDFRIKRGEECKQKLAKEFFEFHNGSREFFYKNVKRNINRLKSFYNLKDEQKLDDEELAFMFLVDGCALLQFIALDVIDAWEEFSVDNDLVSIEKVDFFLLENQLPYQLLEILMDSFTKPSRKELKEINLKELFKKFITEFINKCVFSLTGQQQHPIQDDFSPPHPPHLLDLLRRRLIGKRHKEQVGNNKDGFLKKVQAFHSADKSKHCPSIRKVKEMKEKGIRFKAREKGGGITDVDFKGRYCMATVTLAPIILHNTTVPLLLNLIAYELCPDFKENRDITSHLSFLDFLIDNEEDVKELRDAGVLHNELGSDEDVAELFNRISNILVSNLGVSTLKRRIREYCYSNKSHLGILRDRVEAKLTYACFRSPWMLLVFLAALAGLIMTGMQTYFSFHD